MTTSDVILVNNPLITVGLTCYNAEKTIERALRSALSQDWANFEVIVVDDFSSDASWVIIGSIAEADLRVKAVRHSTNGGAAAARNTILKNASGEFIAFFDDDDESLPDRLRIQYERLRVYEEVHGETLVACYASGIRRYNNGYELEMHAIGSQSKVPVGFDVPDYLLFNGRRSGIFYGAGTPTCALMARRSTFQSIGGFDEQFRRVEDVDFAIRLALTGGHFIGAPQHLFVQYATVASDKTPGKNLHAELQLIEKNAEYLKKRNRYKYAKQWFKIRYFHFSGERLRFSLALLIFLIRYPLNGFIHLIRSVPNRWLHERKMRMSRLEK